MENYISRQRFKEITQFDTTFIDECLVDDALARAADVVRHSLFLKRVYEFTSPDDKFRIETPVGDYTGDGLVDEGDINVFEFDSEDYIDPEIDRNNKILNFNPKYGYIVMDGLYPTNGRKLIIESYIARFDNKTMKLHLPKLVQLLATLSIFETIPISKLQEGITSWNLNGVNVTFDLNSISAIKESIKKEIEQKFYYLKPIISDKTKLGFDNDDKFKWGFTFKTSSGNVYRVR